MTPVRLEPTAPRSRAKLSTTEPLRSLCINMKVYLYDNSYHNDVASGSEIMPCNKIDKPLMVYRCSGKRYVVHSKIAYIITKLYFFTPEMRFHKKNLPFVLLNY